MATLPSALKPGGIDGGYGGHGVPLSWIGLLLRYTFTGGISNPERDIDVAPEINHSAG